MRHRCRTLAVGVIVTSSLVAAAVAAVHAIGQRDPRHSLSSMPSAPACVWGQDRSPVALRSRRRHLCCAGVSRVSPPGGAHRAVCSREAGTPARVPDGRYELELDTGSTRVDRRVFVRNYTPLPSSPLANASAGLDRRVTDPWSVPAAFARRSYRPGELATLRLGLRFQSLVVRVLHAGPERARTRGNDTMRGVLVYGPVRLRDARAIRLRVGDWESGLYTARLQAGHRVGFAPFVVRPRRLGESRVAVVQPTNTWQAYNFRCTNGDGLPDTWYFSSSFMSVDTSRPYLDRGVPPHFRAYDLGFLHWLATRGRRVDMLAQEDLERLSRRPSGPAL